MFYFWLDLIATLSLISDITWIWYPLVGIVEDQDVFNSEGYFDPRLVETKASWAAARVARIMKIIRLVWLIWIVKLYKLAQSAMQKN